MYVPVVDGVDFSRLHRGKNKALTPYGHDVLARGDAVNLQGLTSSPEYDELVNVLDFDLPWIESPRGLVARFLRAHGKLLYLERHLNSLRLSKGRTPLGLLKELERRGYKEAKQLYGLMVQLRDDRGNALSGLGVLRARSEAAHDAEAVRALHRQLRRVS